MLSAWEATIVEVPDAAPRHPLLGAPAAIEDVEGAVAFESEISADRPGFLRDHVIRGRVLFPLAGHVEMALAASKAIALAEGAGGRTCRIEDVAVQAPLVLEETPRRLRTVAEPAGEGRYAVRVTSRSRAGEWKVHARCVVVAGRPAAEAPARDVASLEAQPGEDLDPAALYADAARSRGFAYGEAFRVLRSARQGRDGAWGRAALPASVAMAGYRLHPAMLDAAFQLFGPLLPRAGGAYLPVAIESVESLQVPGRECVVHLVLRSGLERRDVLLADLEVLLPTGAVAARVLGLKIRRMAPALLERVLDSDR
jgi:acyl transferase domain-containing protein